MGLKKNNPGCGCCAETTCSACENVNGSSDDFTTGLQFTISGFTNKAGSVCNCPDFDGTYLVPRISGLFDDARISPQVAGCNGELVAESTCCNDGAGTYQWLLLRWHVWEYITSESLGVELLIYLLEDSDCPTSIDSATERMWLPYYEYGIEESCAAWSSRSLSWGSGSGGYSDAEGCDDYDALTVTCSSY